MEIIYMCVSMYIFIYLLASKRGKEHFTEPLKLLTHRTAPFNDRRQPSTRGTCNKVKYKQLI